MLTGNRRYREQKRFMRPSLLVLQVQYREMEFDPWGGFKVTKWRDATVSDLTIISSIIKHDVPLEVVHA